MPRRVNGESHCGVAGRCGVQSSLYQSATAPAQKGAKAMHKGGPYGGAKKQKGIPVKWMLLQSPARGSMWVVVNEAGKIATNAHTKQ